MVSQVPALALWDNKFMWILLYERHHAQCHEGAKHVKTWMRPHPVYSVIAWVCFQMSIIGYVD